MSERKQAKRRNSAKKNKKKGIIAAVIGTSLLIAFLGILVPPMSLSAVGSFPGIQTVVEKKVSAKQSYRILEIVPNGATGEIGYLAAGFEPEYFQDRLSQYIAENKNFVNTSENRKSYIQQLSEQLEERGLLGEDKPLVYEEYNEIYFPEKRADASWIYFPEDKYQTLELAGTYNRNNSNNGMYRSNIVSFEYNEHGDYSVSFKEGVKKSDEPPYNQPYELTTDGTIVPVTVVNEDRLSSYYYIDCFSYEGTASSNSNYTAVLDEEKPYSYVGTKGDFDFYPQEQEEEEVSPSEAGRTCKVEIGQVAYTGGIINRNWFKSQILNASDVDELEVEVVTVTESELADVELADEALSEIDFLYICGDTSASVSGISPAVTHEYGVGTKDEKPNCEAAVSKLVAMVTDEKLPCMIDSTVWEEAAAVEPEAEESDIYRLVRLANAADSVKGNVYCINTKSADAEEREAFFTDWTEIIQAPTEGEDPYEEVRQLIRQENMFRKGEDVISKDISKITVIQYIINCQHARVISSKKTLCVLDIEPAMGGLYEEGASIPEDAGVLTKAKLSEWTGVPEDNISIVRMTSAEFIGKTEDLNTQYDLVYFGLGYNGDYMNRDSAGKTVYNDSYMDGLVYTHVGDAVLRPSYLAGLLDTDYVNNTTSNYFYGANPDNPAKDAYGYRNQYSAEKRKLISNKTTIYDFQYETPGNANSSWATVEVGNVGVYRYSGNDITKTKLSDLKEYVGAQYPVLFGEGFLKADSSLNDDLVDNSSILYEFMGYKADSMFFVKDGEITVRGSSTAEDDSEQMDFVTYINMPKPKLVLYSPYSSSLEVPEETTINTGEELTIENSYGNKVMQIDGSNSGRGICTIRMSFMLESSVDADLSTRYIPRLYLDLNADGKFVENGSYSDLIRDITIRDSSGVEAKKQTSGEEEEYLLKSGTVYTLEKDIPSEYRGILTWKLELCQKGNEKVRASKIGYTVVSKQGTGQSRAEAVTVAVNSYIDKSSEIIFKTDNGFVQAGNLRKGSFLAYSIDVKEAGKYRVTLRLAQMAGFAENVEIRVDDKTQATVAITPSGSWDSFINHVGEIEFAESGTHKLSLVFDGGCDVADFSYVKKSDGADSIDGIEEVKVLQIMGNQNDYGGKWVLANDADMKKYIDAFSVKEGIEFVLSTTTAEEFSRSYRYKENGAENDATNIKNYGMLIFGFQDSYSDITNSEALDGVDKFINSGKSVLFAHDNTSFVNVGSETQWAGDIGSDKTAYQHTTELSHNLRYWGYNFNQRLRDILGMDRFGITYNEHTAKDQTLSKNRSDLLKQGQLLDITEEQETDSDGNTNTVVTGTIDTSEAAGGVSTRKQNGTDFVTAELGTDKDIAYVARSNRTQAYGETQGYSTGSINFDYAGPSVAETKYRNIENGAWRGNKYMELNVFNDVTDSWQIRMGQVGSMKATQLNDGQITHYPYEIGDEISIADTHYQWWQLNLDQDFDRDGESDIVVWYCLSSDANIQGYNGATNMYNESPNDARNNYYIYSIGNIMYSGVGHSTVKNENEKKLFFNTIVAAYKIGVKNPSVKVLESEDRNAKEKEVEYLPFDESMGENGEFLDNEISFYYTVSDPNLVSSTKKIYAEYSFVGGGTIANTKQTNDVYITTELVGGKTLSTEGSLVQGLRSGAVYKATVHNLDSTSVKNQLAENGAVSIQIRVQSAFTYYGDTYGFEAGNKAAPSATTSIIFQKRTLFDLD